MTPNGQIAIPLDTAAIREPVVNECKQMLSRCARPKTHGILALSAI